MRGNQPIRERMISPLGDRVLRTCLFFATDGLVSRCVSGEESIVAVLKMEPFPDG